jgi:signal transduction histidine kinase
MLDVSRLDSEFVPHPNATTELMGMLREMQDYFSESVAHKSLRYLQNLPEKFGMMVNMDDDHLRKVLLNMIDNAVLYSNAGGQITITAKAVWRNEKEFIWVQVKDDGPGIPESDWDLIFDRFYRGENAQSAQIPGTGLGLALAKTIVERYGGFIELDETITDGACFNLWLPGIQMSADE